MFKPVDFMDVTDNQGTHITHNILNGIYNDELSPPSYISRGDSINDVCTRLRLNENDIDFLFQQDS